jgi:hypothetical protein
MQRPVTRRGPSDTQNLITQQQVVSSQQGQQTRQGHAQSQRLSLGSTGSIPFSELGDSTGDLSVEASSNYDTAG